MKCICGNAYQAHYQGPNIKEPSVVKWLSLATKTVASGRPLTCLLGLSND